MTRKRKKPGKRQKLNLLRGNGEPESIIIYHNNHKIWELTYLKSKKKGKVSFDYNHARYYKRYRQKFQDAFKQCDHICFITDTLDTEGPVTLRTSLTL
ncbi:MAG: hypothetical protein IJT16_05185 [Lachnospiraceae bacterium]|nr:hypothetical protein [Lachnospiraceae bacterium]